MTNTQPYISTYAAIKEKKTTNLTTIGASVIVASTLIASSPTSSAYAAEKAPISQPFQANFSKFMEEFAEETKAQNELVVEVANTDVEMTAEIKKAAKKLADLIEKQQGTQPNSIEITTDKQATIVYNADKEGVSEFEVDGHPLAVDVTKQIELDLKNTFIHPLAKGSYTTMFNKFASVSENGNFHHGDDYPSAENTPVYAAADGKVLYAGAATGYGNWIVVEHHVNGHTVYSIYGHMKQENLFVKEGEQVKKGEIISLVGHEGTANGSELHFSIATARDADEPRLFYSYIDPSFLIDEQTSTAFTYAPYTPDDKVEKEINGNEAKTEEDYWQLAQQAAEIIHWDPYLILSQWQLETGHFTSNNFIQNNNIAGQTWFEGDPEEMKGTPRPSSEGRYYIKYKDPVEGYVQFIQENPRYNHVKEKPTAEEQAKEIKRAGWATDPVYAESLISLIAKNRAKYHLNESVATEETKEETKENQAMTLNEYQEGQQEYTYKGTSILPDKIKQNTEYVLADLTSDTTKLIQNTLVSPINLHDGVSYLSSPFGFRDIGAGKEFHNGIDIASPGGTTIVAPRAGVVVWAGSAPVASYGNLVVVEHVVKDAQGKSLRFYTTYAHMKKESITVRVGDTVKQGDKLAEVGSEGRSTGNHLHMTTHFGFDEIGNIYDIVDPTLFLNMDGSTTSPVEEEVSKPAETTEPITQSEAIEEETITESTDSTVEETPIEEETTPAEPQEELTEEEPVEEDVIEEETTTEEVIDSVIRIKDNDEVEDDLPFIFDQFRS